MISLCKVKIMVKDANCIQIVDNIFRRKIGGKLLVTHMSFVKIVVYLRWRVNEHILRQVEAFMNILQIQIYKLIEYLVQNTIFHLDFHCKNRFTLFESNTQFYMKEIHSLLIMKLCLFHTPYKLNCPKQILEY